jgi:thioredoxin-like negative regulator of GroEL
MVGVVSVLAVVGVLAFAMITGTGTPAGAAIRASAPPVDYAYNDGKATLVMFTATWCQFCAQQKPIVTSLEKDYNGSMYVHYVDIDDSANRTLVNRYGARAVPMIVILDDMGKVVATFRGVNSANTLSAAINRALDESARTPNRTLDET